MKISTIKDNNILLKAGSFFFWIFIWEIIYIIVNNEILIVSPLEVLLRLKVLVLEKTFWEIILLSLLRIMGGFIIGIFIGSILCILQSKFLLIKYIISPVISILRASPVISFIIILLVFVRSQYLPTLISFIIVLPIVFTNLNEGILKIDKKLIEMSNVYKIKPFYKLVKIYIPSIIPYFRSACINSIGFSFKAGISAEVIANTKMSIGGELYNSRIYMDTLDLFSWTVVIIIISMIIEQIVVKLINSN